MFSKSCCLVNLAVFKNMLMCSKKFMGVIIVGKTVLYQIYKHQKAGGNSKQ